MDVNKYPSKKVLDHAIQLMSWTLSINTHDVDLYSLKKIKYILSQDEDNIFIKSRPEIEAKYAEYVNDLNEIYQDDGMIQDKEEEKKIIFNFLIDCCSWILRSEKNQDVPPDANFISSQEMKKIEIPVSIGKNGTDKYYEKYYLLISYQRALRDEPGNKYLAATINQVKKQIEELPLLCPSYSYVSR
jgi:hypothetical protein